MKCRLLGLLFLLGLIAGQAPGQGVNEAYVSTFELVWRTVDETFPDPAFGGLNWKEVHDRYRPRVAAAGNDETFYGLINNMLWELKVSHANMIPPRSFSLFEPLSFAEGGPGLDLRLLEGEVVITSVAPGSPASKAGLRAGYGIKEIDGTPVEAIVREAGRVDPPPANSLSRKARATKALLGRIYGPPGTDVSIGYEDENGRKDVKRIPRVKRSGAAVGPGGAFFMASEHEARRLENGVGYFQIKTTLQPDLARWISEGIRSMADLTGVVIDLRGNSGGAIEGMPELFLAEKNLLYYRKDRAGETGIFSEPSPAAYKGPMVILVDALSGSASELFAAFMQASGRAKVVGERSPGLMMEANIRPFPEGAVLMYPVAQGRMPDGTALEGRGVVPDIEVGLSREALLGGVDSQLEAAVGWVKKTSLSPR